MKITEIPLLVVMRVAANRVSTKFGRSLVAKSAAGPDDVLITDAVLKSLSKSHPSCLPDPPGGGGRWDAKVSAQSKTNSYLQKAASIQPRTCLSNFAKY